MLRGHSVPRPRPAPSVTSSPLKDYKPLRRSLYSHRGQSVVPDTSPHYSALDYSRLRAIIDELRAPLKLPHPSQHSKSLQYRYLYRLHLKKPTQRRPKQLQSVSDLSTPLQIIRAHAEIPVKKKTRSLSVPRQKKSHVSVMLPLPTAQHDQSHPQWLIRVREEATVSPW